MFCTFIKGSGL